MVLKPIFKMWPKKWMLQYDIWHLKGGEMTKKKRKLCFSHQFMLKSQVPMMPKRKLSVTEFPPDHDIQSVK